ncbi:MAG: 3-oxo-5-alpha-steroid 4-dehydrogenase [Bacteroidota bacterium]|nr:3-oxo-5-alpha-steroid 4-dehydrogenase [Bacteroidota bacterium]
MDSLYKYSIILIFGFAALVFVILFFVSAPYGKFSRRGWGTAIRSKWAWMIMEMPSPALMIIFFISSKQKDLPQAIFLGVWLSHYLLRTFIYPFRQSGKQKPFPVLLVVMALTFNCLNGFANGYGIFRLSTYDQSWIFSWQFISGILFFLAGFAINKTADEKFRMIREQNHSEYVIPEGWMFEYISCPHYLGEITEWAGWALMTWSVPGLAFFIFTFANLFPRAIRTHKWYQSKFPGYPNNRKAVIPFII